MKNALFVFSGNARTFVDCIDSACTHLITKLFIEDVNIYIYFYLKLTDPGPKGQDDWNFTYKDNDYNTILDKIHNINSKYPNFSIDYKLLNSNELLDSELISQVKNRSLYIGYYIRDHILLRGLHNHYNLEKCGNYILEKEISIQSKFDYIISVRPDLFFTSSCNNIETYNTSIVTFNNGCHHGGLGDDYLAIVPREYVDAFFFGRMSIYRNNTDKFFNMPEDVYRIIAHDIQHIGLSYLKRY